MSRKLLSHYRAYMGATLGTSANIHNAGQIAKVAEMRALREDLRARQPESLALRGFKVSSQNEEDGIIAAIFEHIQGSRTFLEIGVEDGTECNTHYLALQGWRGAWVEADAAHAAAIATALGRREFPNRFRLFNEYARTDNIARIYKEVCDLVGEQDLDFFSLDIDGNDIYVLEALMNGGARPKVLCVEYNAKFPPPLKISVTLNEDRAWKHDDYFGASLQMFADVASSADYALVSCNLAGTNAFFVKRDELAGLRPVSVDEAWQPLRLYLASLPPGHIPTLKHLRDVLARS